MLTTAVVVLCSLLQAGNEGTVPNQPVRQRSVQPPQFPSGTPATPVPTAPPTAPPAAPAAAQTKQLRSKGVLKLPKHNQVTLSAKERAELVSLNTEQRDAAGNILRDSEGNPVMIPIRKGLYVFKDQVLGNFDDRELLSILEINQAKLEVAKAERNKDIEKIYAARSLQVAMQDVQRMTDANQRQAGVFAQADIDRAILVQYQASANLDLQKYTIEEIKTREVSVQEAELKRTKIQIEDRKLIAPIDGMIVRIEAAVGELKREGEPILEIVQLDILHVVVQVNVKDYRPHDLDGKQAVIHVPFPNGRTETFQGAVVFCNPLVTVDSFEVLIEVQNRRTGNYWLLQPGHDDVEVVIPL